MDKQTFRKIYLERRKSLTKEEIDKASVEIANQLLTLDIWNHKNYHLFLSIEKQNEINTQYILNILMGKDKNIILSKSNFQDYTMTHHLLTDQTVLKVNQYGIPEPEQSDFRVDEKEIDVIFVPLLAFDLNGNRIGYGKGFYDRFLSRCRSNALKIGLSFFHPENHVIDLNNNDIALDFAVVNDKVYKF